MGLSKIITNQMKIQLTDKRTQTSKHKGVDIKY